MSLLLCGIDEAGYGPTLGPLCVGMSVIEAPRPERDDAGAPCLWKLLERGVCRTPGRSGRTDAQGRVAIADSKQLKLASSVTTTHPLVHLERGVLTFLSMVEPVEDATPPTTDLALFHALRASLPAHACYEGDPLALPVAGGAPDLAIRANMVRGAASSAGVRVRAMRCRVMGEDEFNTLADAGGKGATTLHTLAEHLRSVWEDFASVDDQGRTRLGVVCDRLGGRVSYAAEVACAIPGARVEVVEESPTRSRYRVTNEDGSRRMALSFLVESEQAHLPVALASMTAKYVRELCMARFNRWWGTQSMDLEGRELKPTAGYALDAQRWLRDAKPILSREDYRALVRRA